MGKLAEMWEQWRQTADDDPRKARIEEEIGRIEQWMIDNGHKKDGLTRFHRSAPNPDYPENAGCIWFEDADIDGHRVMLLSSAYDGDRVVLKVYSPELGKIILLPREYGQSVYVTPQTFAQIDGVRGESVPMYDTVRHETRDMVRIPAHPDVIRNFATWNHDMRRNHAYAYDEGLRFGSWYVLDADGRLHVSHDDDSRIDIPTDSATADFGGQMQAWSRLLSQEMPRPRRVAFDIEVEVTGDTVPDPAKAPNRVTAISFHGEDIARVHMLRRPECPKGDPSDAEGYEIVWYDDEKAMLEDSFAVIQNYPMVLTYNGDTFDMPYLYNRAIGLGIGYVPFRMMAKNATLETGIHVDMYGIFSNRSLKIYAFGNSYVRNGLGDVAESLLGEAKTEYEGTLTEIPLSLLAKYCHNDSRLTYMLSSYDDHVVMNMLITLIRVANLPVDDVSRRAISAWAKSMIHAHHVRHGELIPNSSDFPDVAASTSAVIRDKKYHGAIVMEPVRGVHFGVTVLDFASLYPTIIEKYNCSYDSICCPCCKGKRPVPGTSHWICEKRTGTISLLIGSLKHLRVGHYKRLYRETGENRYRIIEQTLKVFLNASYGIIGADTFPLYFLPTAESVTAIGRNIISETAKKAESLGMRVLYGDTDSIFVEKPSLDQVASMISYCQDAHSVELEVDKEYRYLVLSDRKKNYFGVKKDGKLDIKGLAGKKSNTPVFLQRLFAGITDILGTVAVPEDLGGARARVTNLVRSAVDGIRDLPLEEMAFNVRINQEPAEYRTKPQAVRAAEQLGKPPQKGQFVSFVKTWKQPGVMPVERATAADIDYALYHEAMEGTLRQITDMIGVDYDVIMGRGRQTSLDAW